MAAVRFLVLLAVAIAITLTSGTSDGRSLGPATQSALTLTDAGTALVAMPGESPRELSGLTYAGGDLFYAVSDSSRLVHPFAITLNRGDGRIVSVVREEPIVLRDETGDPTGGSDLEGIAFDPATRQVVVVNEAGLAHPRRSILIHRLDDGRQIGAVDLSDTPFTSGRVRSGLGLESLAMRGGVIWTANEEALSGDGARSSTRGGTTVRLTRFEQGRLTGQWAYVTEPTGGMLPYFNTSMAGVVDLGVLSDGRLLVLERATATSQAPGDIGGFISRIYEVEVSGATDISAEPRLESRAEGAGYTPVAKRLLWSRFFSLLGGPNNFEGLALGPLLSDGSRSVLLISDNDVLPSNLWALRLSGSPAP